MKQRHIRDILDEAITKALNDLPSALPGIVTAITGATLSVQPTGAVVVDGKERAFPLLTEVIPLILYGGSSYDAYPVVAGDHVLLIVGDRSLDEFYAGDDTSTAADNRRHDYSDCVAVVGIRPGSNAIDIPTVIERIGDAHVVGNYVHEGNYDQTGRYDHTGDTIQTGNETQVGNKILTGDITQTGNVNQVGSSLITGSQTVTVQITTPLLLALAITLAGVDIKDVMLQHTHPVDTPAGSTGTGVSA